MELRPARSAFLAAAVALSAAAVLVAANPVGHAHEHAAAEVDGPVIGIDLGTTYSCVAIYKNGQVEVVPNEQGARTTPSVVAFVGPSGGERLVGEAAKNQAAENPERTLFDAKRFIGKRFGEASLRRDVESLPFHIVDEEGAAAFSLATSGGKHKSYLPEQVSAAVLGKLKESAEKYLGHEVKYAVVTVPASFNNAQRHATKDAGAIAGLEVIRVVNEPTAAAVAYGLDHLPPSEGARRRTVLVYDLGGGTFDVSLLAIEGGTFEVLATAGDPHLGGEDFDRNVAQHLAKAYEKKHGKPANSPEALSKLRREAERLKRQLSSMPQAKFSVEGLDGDGLELSGSLTRARFEELNLDHFKRTISLVQQVMQDAGTKKEAVDDIVLVGGSTRIPKIQQLVKEFFGGKEPVRGINPDEAIAHGAAIQAAALSHGGWASGGGPCLMDVAPLTLGIETVGGVMTPVIARNTAIPARNSTIFTTHKDNQPALDIKVFEGERLLTKSNHLLGKFRLGGISPARRGTVQVEVVFTVDENGILTVTAEDSSTGKSQQLTVTGEDGRLSAQRIEEMIREAEDFTEEDKEAKDLAEARTALEVYLWSLRDLVDEDGSLDEDDLAKLRAALFDGQDFLADSPEAVAGEVREKLQELEGLCDDIVAEHRAGGGPGSSGGAGAGGSVGGGGGGGGDGEGEDDDMEGHDEL